MPRTPTSVPQCVRRFGRFRFDRTNGILIGPEGEVRLRPTTFRLLCAFIESRGSVLEKDALIQQVWSGRIVSDGALAREVSDLRRALGDDPSRPQFIETRHRRGYRWLPEMVAERPAERTVSRGDHGFEQPVGVARWRSLRWLVSVVTACGLALAGWLAFGDRDAVATRPSIAVIGFANLTRDEDRDWMASAVREMISTQLVSDDWLRVVPTQTAARVRMELGIAPTTTLAKDTLASVRRNIGVEYVAVGSYFALEGSETSRRIHLDVKVQRTDDGTTVASAGATGSPERLPELVGKVSEELLAALSVPIRDKGARVARSLLPDDIGAAKLYARGLERLRLLDPGRARELLQSSVSREPSFALAHAALARAWLELGDVVCARRAAEQALQLGDESPRERRLELEALVAETRHDWDAARAAYRALWMLHPDDLEIGLRLGEAQIRGGRPAAARRTADELRRLPGAAGDDPRIYLMEARAANAVSHFDEQAALAEKAVREAEKRGAGLLAGRGKMALVEADWGRGRLNEALATCREARRLFADAGDVRSAATALHDEACLLWGQGNVKQAAGAFEAVIREARTRGDLQQLARALSSCALMRLELGMTDEAGPLYAEALTIRRRLHDTRGIGIALLGTGAVHARRGRLEAAEASYMEAVTRFQDCGDRPGEGYALFDRADVLVERDQLRAAQACYEQALEIFRQRKHRPWIARCLAAVARVRRLEGAYGVAGRWLDEARRAARSVDETGLQTILDVEDALLALAEGRPRHALKAASRAVQLAETAADPPQLARALEVLARCHVACRDAVGARSVIRRALDLEAARTDVTVCLRLELDEVAACALEADEAPSAIAPIGVAERARELGLSLLARRAPGWP